MAPGVVDAVTREMIYHAVSATNQRPYCIASHTAAERRAGITDRMFAELMAERRAVPEAVRRHAG
jgi:AhpD family alkylhydroperoxidase